MELTWHPATAQDIKLLTKTHIDMLRATQGDKLPAELGDLLVQTYEYFKEMLNSGTYAAYLVMKDEEAIGFGSIRLYRVPPTPENPTGRMAQIGDLYTHPDYRRQGIAYRTCTLLIAAAGKQGAHAVTLQENDEIRPLVEKFGFVAHPSGMILRKQQPKPESTAEDPAEDTASTESVEAVEVPTVE